MKECSKCKAEKSLDEYYKHSMTADGYYPCCKKCHNEKCKISRSANVIAYRQKQRERAQTLHGKQLAQKAYKKALKSGARAERTRAWRLKNPEKYQAHLAVKKAIYKNLIERTGCAICGKKAQAHHEDYSKPLEVMWLCQAHHAEHHTRKRNGD